VDLACLSYGLVDVMVPGNATEAQVGFILRHAAARTVVVSGASQLRKIAVNRKALPALRHVVTLQPTADRGERVLTLDRLIQLGTGVDADQLDRRRNAVRVDDLATLMYTSGTTGTPKGIQFSQRNLVFKRFARGLAIPGIGDGDVFLCFLPLFHTFGRFLEMLGCVFWGATYCFLDNPSIESLIGAMGRVRPSVFISVPKKWIQLYESIAALADPVQASDAELSAATQRLTGGRLRWGLSAAGHLDPDVFRFFQRQGVELMSGFGMTEATGGITMTPPGEYRDDSLGLPLPGIELKLAPDGELCIRGPYVMMGYLDEDGSETSFDDEGWLHTGDLMQQDADGHLRLVDRKKEIYKNIKGETIAPQRIENMFRDFESVGRAFLVGDHRENNTLLIHPNYQYKELDFASLPPQQVKDHFRSLVVSVNKFLAPFERIVDFAVVERDLSADHGELTAKGTPRRKRVVENFRDTIALLYRRTRLDVGGLELNLPNWVLQMVGLTTQDIRVGADHIDFPQRRGRLTVRPYGRGMTLIGSCIYRHPVGPLNLGDLLSTPGLWLGNEQLVAMVGFGSLARQRPRRGDDRIEWAGRDRPSRPSARDRQTVARARQRDVHELADLHHAALLLAAPETEPAREALQLIASILADEGHRLSQPAQALLLRAADAAHDDVARRAFQILVPATKDDRFAELLERFLTARPAVMNADTREELSRKYLTPAKIDAFVSCAERACLDSAAGADERAGAMLRFLSAYGASHPASYRRLRNFLVRMREFAVDDRVRAEAARSIGALRDGFRSWLGPTSAMAVDTETGREYRWDDVIVFDDEVPDEDRERILAALRDTALLREASFLFAKGILIRLDDIPPGGVWIRLLGRRHGKSVYRLTVQTRFHGALDLALNLNHSLSADLIDDEVGWLMIAAGADDGQPLVEEFGGYWPEQELWSEEFVSGETLNRALRRLARRSDDQERLRQLWPFLAWTGLSAYVDFWHRTGGRWEIADPDLANVIVPTDDYHTGVRIVSVSSRRPHVDVASMMRGFVDDFIEPTVQQYPVLRDVVGWDVVFSSLFEVVGEERGLELMAGLVERDDDHRDSMSAALVRYVDTVRVRGFLPRRLFFAAKRYRRWASLSTDATPQARARTLQELYDTYGLQQLTRDYPEVRLRYFRETVFREGPEALLTGLDRLIGQLRKRELVGDQLIDAVADLRARLKLDENDDYFLARVSLPYLRPEDAADFVSSDSGGRHQSEIVVALEDHDGNVIRVRHALTPKEVGKLHRLFQAAKVDVTFRPEHRYLVAINDRQQIIGGIYYEIDESGASAHLEKIVVSDAYRRKGVADGLMNELFNRLRSAGMKTVTTGFFRPGYFYSYGFRIEKRYAGLVKSLTEETTARAGATPAS
ncbi:MAG TPA: GNAT family N-acetyltransferase, partial [Candidatus Polarisedimenticolaceae bacterium]|nr:GNAT family N-acetyltransferase [Candidatus Polarisedimenticolaceae bacterium]